MNMKGTDTVHQEVEVITVAHVNDQMVIECAVQVKMPSSTQTTQTSPAKTTDHAMQIAPVAEDFSMQTLALTPMPISPTSSSSKESDAVDLRPKIAP